MNTAAPPPSQPRLRRALVIVSLFLLVGVAAAAAARTVLVEAAARAWLAGQGVAPVDLHVTELGWTAVRVEGLRLTDQVTVARLDVKYRPAELLQGQVAALDVSGVRLDIADLDSGLVGVLRQKLAAASGGGGSDSVLPAIALHDVQAHVRLAGVDATAVLTGAVRPDGMANIDLSTARVAAPGVAPLTIAGRADYDGARVVAELAVQAAGRPERIGVSAAFDPAARRARVTLDKTAFAPDGLQPDDLVPALAAPLAGLGGVRATLDGTATITLTADGPDLQAQIAVADLGLTQGDVTLADGAATLAAAWPAGAAAVSVHVTDARAAVLAQGQQARVDALSAQARFVPVTGALDVALDGARLSHPWLAPIQVSGKAALANGAATFTVRAGDGLLGVQGRHDLASGRGGAEVQAGPWTFASAGTQPRDLSPLLGAIEDARGGFGARAAIAWGDGDVDGTAQLTLDDLSLTVGALRLDGVDGDVDFAELTPPHMAAAQTLRARSLDGGVAVLNEPRLTFRLDRDGRLAIEHGQGRIAGGVIALDGQVIDVHRPNHDVMLTFADLDLAALFGLLNVDGVSGEGRLSGVVPLSVSAQAVTIADGRFIADGPGVLRVRSGAARQALGNAGADAVLLLDVLEDFRYHALDLRVDKDGGGEATVRLSTEGSNPAVMEDQPFKINVNLTTRLDKVLATLGTAMRLSREALRDTVDSLSGIGR